MTLFRRMLSLALVSITVQLMLPGEAFAMSHAHMNHAVSSKVAQGPDSKPVAAPTVPSVQAEGSRHTTSHAAAREVSGNAAGDVDLPCCPQGSCPPSNCASMSSCVSAIALASEMTCQQVPYLPAVLRTPDKDSKDRSPNFPPDPPPPRD